MSWKFSANPWLDLVAVQISIHTHYFNSWTQLFKWSWLLKLISHGIQLSLLLNKTYTSTLHCCYWKGSQSSPQCYYSITNKTICNCLWITIMRLGNHHHDFVMNLFSLKTARFRKNFTRGIMVSWCSNFLQFVFDKDVAISLLISIWEQCARGQIIRKMLLNTRGTASIVFLVPVMSAHDSITLRIPSAHPWNNFLGFPSSQGHMPLYCPTYHPLNYYSRFGNWNRSPYSTVHSQCITKRSLSMYNKPFFLVCCCATTCGAVGSFQRIGAKVGILKDEFTFLVF